MSASLLINPTAMEAGLMAAAKARAAGPGQAAALKAFARTGLPHRRMEGWKWTDLRQALRAELPPADGEAAVIAPSSFSGVDAFEITIMNGAAEWPDDAPEGLSVRLVEGGGPAPAVARDHPTGNLAVAMCDRIVELRIGKTVARPIHLRRIAGGGASHSRVAVIVEEGAGATLIESYDGAGRYFANSLTEIDLGRGARLTRDILQDGSDDGVEAALCAGALAEGAAFHQLALLLGGKTVRMETRLALEGAQAEVDFRGASILSGARHADLTTHVAHHAPGSTTRQLHKSVLRERARGVFQGKFLVARGAQKTDAQMQARALLLSEAAEVDHKPELEIYADDVQCAHGAAAGALDADALFYMRQRGLDEKTARALLVEAFLGEIFDRPERVNIAEILRRRMRCWLESAP
ncbi:Fe-S cluster assembly protein SufD [Amphiplicatus metriothermophilus]|uniref:Fe-S cluster assembly protein SufD n=1 Tax=Amphiplicatus metriothermophilus TaxID=1519374 RepID=A0A239PSI2_9PROT|nr:Fe-S cluster assembly protein SufD [Amphiplicatus metriothermophilus]MBB5519185.1 Fe-S cluster assembly protein SufD [Amphiplicatus metriothermophilus]SNT73254.1 Fe-S cluster assembly protein SufD [Amphiplicatus metriothermophilus]